MEENELLSLMEFNPNNMQTLDDINIGKLFSNLTYYKDILDKKEKELRSRLLELMLQFKIDSFKKEGYTFSTIKGKNTIVFDENSFLQNEDENLIAAVTSCDIRKEFDMERFQKENSELYEKYLTPKYDVHVDTAILERTYPEIYSKYATEVVSDKAPSLRVSRPKGSN